MNVALERHLITGAAGHLGNVLARELIADGQLVRALVMPGENTLALEGLPVEIVTGDILDQRSLEEAMTDVQTVYHMAALVSIVPGQEGLLHKVNVTGTENVLNAARQAGVRRLVYTSSIHALARPPMGVAIDESQPFDIENPAGPYDRTKAQASVRVQQAARDGLEALIVCPTGVLGPHDYRRSEVGSKILDWMGRKVDFLVDGWFDFVDVRDIARGHILAARRGCSGETYILGGERIALEQMRTIVKDYTGSHSPLVRAPISLALAVAPALEWYYRVTRTRATITRYSLETVTSNSQISSARAQQELGYRARTMQDALIDTVNWWRQNQARIPAGVRL